jgi:hypothetical protein
MKLGEEAIKRLAESDASRGMVAPDVKRRAEAAYKSGQPAPVVTQAPQDGALSDRDIASNMLAQAQRMEVEAKGMIAEAARMKKNAERMHPSVVASTESPVTVETTKKRGRPSKQAVADATQ